MMKDYSFSPQEGDPGRQSCGGNQWNMAHAGPVAATGSAGLRKVLNTLALSVRSETPIQAEGQGVKRGADNS